MQENWSSLFPNGGGEESSEDGDFDPAKDGSSEVSQVTTYVLRIKALVTQMLARRVHQGRQACLSPVCVCGDS